MYLEYLTKIIFSLVKIFFYNNILANSFSICFYCIILIFLFLLYCYCCTTYAYNSNLEVRNKICCVSLEHDNPCHIAFFKMKGQIANFLCVRWSILYFDTFHILLGNHWKSPPPSYLKKNKNKGVGGYFSYYYILQEALSL